MALGLQRGREVSSTDISASASVTAQGNLRHILKTAMIRGSESGRPRYTISHRPALSGPDRRGIAAQEHRWLEPAGLSISCIDTGFRSDWSAHGQASIAP